MQKYKVHMISLILILLVYLSSFLQDEISRDGYLVSSYAIVGFAYILFILILPFISKKFGILRDFYSQRMWLGIYSFVFVAIHVILALDVFYSFDLNILLSSANLYIYFGIMAFLILVVMTITSNRFSMRKLGKKWKFLHNLVFIAIILIFIHSLNVGLYFMSRLEFQIVLFLIVIFVVGLKIRYSLLNK